MLSEGVAILGHPGGRPPPQNGLPYQWAGNGLRSSVTPEGDRHRDPQAVHPQVRAVAILGHPGGRPPRAGPRSRRPRCSRCDPRSPRRATATVVRQVRGVVHHRLRSSVTPEGDRHSWPGGAGRAPADRCDPRSPRRATATLADQHIHRIEWRWEQVQGEADTNKVDIFLRCVPRVACALEVPKHGVR